MIIILEIMEMCKLFENQDKKIQGGRRCWLADEQNTKLNKITRNSY